jgi:hypothetical protein
MLKTVVGVFVGVSVGDDVTEGVKPIVCVGVTVEDGVGVGLLEVGVTVGVGVCVGVTVLVGVFDGVAIMLLQDVTLVIVDPEF